MSSSFSSGRIGTKPRLLSRGSRIVSVVPRAAIELPSLPYPTDALEPLMCKDTLEIHWGRHHRAYVDNLNKQLESNSALNGKDLEDIILATWNGGSPTAEFNNAA